MKILFVTSNLVAGGAERQWQRLASGLAREGHEPRVVALDSGGPVVDGLVAGAVDVTVVGIRHQLDLAPLRKVSAFADFTPDVVVSRDTSGMCIATAIGRLRRIPHVHTDHRQIGMQLNPRRELLTRLNAPYLDGVVLVSAQQRSMWEGQRVSKARFAVIPNGVDDPPVGDRAALREQLGLRTDDTVVMMTATLRAEKRVSDFINAIKRVRQADARAVGVVVGGGEQLELARGLTDGDPGFRLLGHRDDVSVLLQAADIFVLPSSMEAQPLAVLEALASGLPVIATSVGDIPSMVTDENGRRFPVGDVAQLAAHISELLNNPAVRSACGARGRWLWEQQWQADAMVGHYSDFFANLISKRSESQRQPEKLILRALGWN